MIAKRALLKVISVRPTLNIVPLESRVCIAFLGFACVSINVYLPVKAAESGNIGLYLVGSV